VSGLQTREGAAPTLLHFIVQDSLHTSFGEAPAHIGHGLLTDIESRRKLTGTPPVC